MVKSAISATAESISHLEGRLRVAKRFNQSPELSFGSVVACSHDFRYVSVSIFSVVPILFVA